MRADSAPAAALVAVITIVLGCKPTHRRSAKDAPRPGARAFSPRGWRCPPGGKACVDRSSLAPNFRCEGARCVQLHPAMPDDGEWICGEAAGITLCTSGESAAGVAPTGIAPGWICGSRRKHGERQDGNSSPGSSTRETGTNRVCVDASPDFPDGKPTGWRCSFDGPALPNRVCVRDPRNHSVGDTCTARKPCVDGSVCRDGICVLPTRAPTCWLDADCPAGPCRFGSCAGDPVIAVGSPTRIPSTSKVESVPSRLDFGPPLPQVGFDSDFTVTVKVPAGPRPKRITWKQIGGHPLPKLRPSEDGFRLNGRTVPWEIALGASEPTWGVVPISPRTSGEAVLEASWTVPGKGVSRHEVRVAAASLSRGLTTIPTGARVYLGGDGWHLVSAASGSQATIEDRGGLASFLPDLSGVWRLRDGKGRTLDLIAGRYDDVPLDCSRARCHVEMLAGSLVNPMTTVMARLLDRIPDNAPNADRAVEYPGCALSCHATGQPGISDGGFHDVARSMNRTGEECTPWPDLPRMLRRLGGAGCLSCHGPGAVPDPRASWTTLRSDVCAVCHDAPPVYRHVLAWRSSANSRADRDPDAASKPACTRCHTTWGFLLAEKRKPSPPSGAPVPAPTTSPDHLTFMASLRPPAQAGPIGISCAACHDSHPVPGADGKTPHALLRKVEHPALLPVLPADISRRSEICLPCHTPDLSQPVPPFASAAAIWLGRGGLDPSTGAAMQGPAPLADLEGGCLHCHRGEADGARGSSHSFVATRESCPACPKLDPKRPDGVQRRARQLYLDARLYRVLGDVRPLHASTAILRRDSPTRRALWNLLLLLEDKAAEIHNAPYASTLLESAERVLRSRSAPREPAGGRR